MQRMMGTMRESILIADDEQSMRHLLEEYRVYGSGNWIDRADTIQGATP